MKMRRVFLPILSALVIVVSLVFSECASAQADLVPLSPNDRVLLNRTLLFPWTPVLGKPIDQPVILGTVLFDGTWNDRSNVAKGERQTIEAHLYDKLHGLGLPIFHYYVGAGTQNDKVQPTLDGALGYSVRGTAEKAVDEVVSQIVTLRQKQPHSEIRLFVSGFSRGSAAARHFMNTIEQRWRNQELQGSPPTFYALIFDTVATGQEDNLQLQIPVHADIFYHIVSATERRILFRSILDDPLNDPEGRNITIIRPGVHSDIGTSYPTGIGSEYIAYTDALISSMGLISSECYVVNGDARSQGKNDSRWLLERALGIGAPDTSDDPEHRASKLIPISSISEDYRQQWHRRMLALQFENRVSKPMCVSEHYLGTIQFSVKRIKGGFDVASLPPNPVFNPKIQSDGNKYFLDYTADGTTQSHISVPTAVLSSMSDGQSVQLDLGFTTKKDGSADFWWFVDKVRNQKADATLIERR